MGKSDSANPHAGLLHQARWPQVLLYICMQNLFENNSLSLSLQRLVLDGMTHYKNKNGEIHRYESLVKNFEQSVHLDMKVAYMSFINALINVPTDIDMRISIRNEFIRLGITHVIEKFKAMADEKEDIELVTQIDVFEEESGLDYSEIHDRFALLDVDIK
jgi:hypothetical protein